MNLAEIREKYDVICAMAETDGASATTGAALRYSMDVPALLKMVDQLLAEQADVYQARDYWMDRTQSRLTEVTQLSDRVALAEEVCRYFDDPDSDDAGQGLIEAWHQNIEAQQDPK